MRQWIAFINRYSMADTLPSIQNYTVSPSTGINTQNSLLTDIKTRDVESFKHDLGHFLLILKRIERCFCEQNRMFFWSDFQLLVKTVVPYFFHVVPILNDSLFDGVRNGEHSPFLLSFVAYVGFLLVHPHHYSLVFWSSDYSWECWSRGFVSRYSCFYHSWSVVYHNCCWLVFCHFSFYLLYYYIPIFIFIISPLYIFITFIIFSNFH